LNKLSIITINYNNIDGLIKTVNSVINQTFKEFEYIVIDGGSTDNSIEVIKDYTNHINYFVSEPDNGIYHAMNKGILKAKGEYCFFLNSGDWFVSDKTLEEIFANAPDFDILYGRLIICDKNDKIISRTIGKNRITLLDVYNHTIKHQSSFIKRELFNRYGLYNENLKIISDWAFFMKSVGLGDASVKYLDLDIAFFDNSGISSNSEEICKKERKFVLDSLLSPRTIEDYNIFSSPYLNTHVLNYKLSRYLLRALNKAVKEYEKLLKKGD
jgi:glycosyltransferase involved in cell wall biosynthesis